MVASELLHCFSGDAFLFIDSIISTIKEALQAGTMSKNTLFHLSVMWNTECLGAYRTDIGTSMDPTLSFIIFILQLSLRFSEKLHAVVC